MILWYVLYKNGLIIHSPSTNPRARVTVFFLAPLLMKLVLLFTTPPKGQNYTSHVQLPIFFSLQRGSDSCWPGGGIVRVTPSVEGASHNYAPEWTSRRGITRLRVREATQGGSVKNPNSNHSDTWTRSVKDPCLDQAAVRIQPCRTWPELQYICTAGTEWLIGAWKQVHYVCNVFMCLCTFCRL